MMNWLKDRFSEPSTYAGLGSVAAGVGVLADFDEAPIVVDAISNVGGMVATGGFSWPGLVMILLGSLGVLLKDKGGRSK